MKQLLTTKKYLLGALGIFVVLLTAIYLSGILSKEKYYNFDTYKLPGFIKGSGMSFLKPTQAKAVKKLPDTKDSQEFVDTTYLHNKDQDTLTVFYEAATSQYNFTTVDYTDKQITSVQNVYLDINNPNYKLASGLLGKFVVSLLNPRFHVAVSNYRKYTSSNIPNGAVIADINGSDPHPLVKEFTANLKGNILYVEGKKGDYYFMLAAVDSRWDANKQNMSNILSSLKIDQ